MDASMMMHEVDCHGANEDPNCRWNTGLGDKVTRCRRFFRRTVNDLAPLDGLRLDRKVPCGRVDGYSSGPASRHYLGSDKKIRLAKLVARLYASDVGNDAFRNEISQVSQTVFFVPIEQFPVRC